MELVWGCSLFRRHTGICMLRDCLLAYESFENVLLVWGGCVVGVWRSEDTLCWHWSRFASTWVLKMELQLPGLLLSLAPVTKSYSDLVGYLGFRCIQNHINNKNSLFYFLTFQLWCLLFQFCPKNAQYNTGTSERRHFCLIPNLFLQLLCTFRFWGGSLTEPGAHWLSCARVSQQASVICLTPMPALGVWHHGLLLCGVWGFELRSSCLCTDLLWFS